jgi:hypothetical protein
VATDVVATEGDQHRQVLDIAEVIAPLDATRE